jgi:hypothetical protein
MLSLIKVKKPFFFEKKKQKTFANFPLRSIWLPRAQMCKSFLVLFFKKEHPCFAPLTASSPAQAPQHRAGAVRNSW